uniref:Hydroxylysine kinase n=1 Tax=Haemonchus contortus TaxID=6289 RepID=A0A7I4Y793_HAECO|nr:unnamed protein product [Haemonchus contortus]
MEPYSCDEITQAHVPDYYHLHRLLKSSYGINQAGLEELTDVVWENGTGCSKAILKVSNPLEAKCEQNIDFQIKICQVLNEEGIPCPTTIKRLDGRDWAFEEILDGVHLPVRLFEIIPGSNLENFTYSSEVIENLGELLAKFHVIADKSKLKVAHVPYIAIEHRRGILKEAELLMERSLISKEKFQLIAECLAEFDDRIGKHRELYEIGLIHSDINETNVLMIERNGKAEITGLLDFGDVHESFRIIDIASTILYLYLSDKQKQTLEFLTDGVLKGYQRVRNVPDCTHLFTAMKARLSCFLVYGLRTARMNLRGGNVDYVLRTQSNGWEVLQELHQGAS